MAINFPSNPNPGDIYSFGDRNWEYTGKGWRLLSQISLANSAFNRANSSFITANAAFDAANGAIAVNLTQNTNIQFAWNHANAAFIAANNATDTFVRAHANAAFHQANAAYNQANTNASDITVIQSVNVTQNTSISNLQGVDLTQNTNIITAQNKADSAFHQANAAFLAANNATDTYVRNHANSAFDQANAAYAQANTNASNITIIQGVNVTQNTNISDLQAINLTQNTSISNIEGVNLTQNSNITAAQNKADSSFHQANAAYGQANTNAADIVVLQAVNVTQNTNISNIEGVNLTQNTNITNAQNTATAAYNRANNSLNANTGGVITGPVTVAANLTVTGNLTIIGNTVTTDIQSLNIGDPLIYLAANNYSGDAVEIGFAANYYDGATQRHTGVFREASNKEYYVFDNYTPEPDANLIDINDVSFRIATLNANLKSQSITLNGQNFQTYVDGAYNTANAAFSSANNINGVNLTQNTSITNAQNSALSAFNQANASYAQGNTNAADIVVLQAVNLTQNTSISALQAVNLTQNTNITNAQNSADSAFIQANAAFGSANNINGVNVTQNNSITAAFIQANAAFNAANNATDTYVRAHANAAFNQANAAFDKANTAGVVIAVDAFIGTGSCTTFSLSTTPANKNFTVVTVSGVTQAKATYNLSGASVVFSEAPPNNSNVEVIIFTASGASFLAYNDIFTGTGACTTFTLTTTPTNKNYSIISVSGVIQHKATYNLSGLNVVFSEAPPNNATIDATYFVASTLLDSALTVYAANHANAAFIAANNATDTYVRNHANSAFHQANAAFVQANTNATNITVIQGVNTSQNNEITYAENHANSAFHQANGAFNAANTITVINGLFFAG